MYLAILQNAAAQRAGLKQFIAQDKYLKDLRGQYTEKYGGVTPGYSQIDMRILQDFNIGKDKKQIPLQLSLDFVNLGNLLSSKWGVRKYATTSGYYQPLSVTVAGTVPSYKFDPSQKETFVSNPELQSRWQMQFGVRYIF